MNGSSAPLGPCTKPASPRPMYSIPSGPNARPPPLCFRPGHWILKTSRSVPGSTRLGSVSDTRNSDTRRVYWSGHPAGSAECGRLQRRRCSGPRARAVLDVELAVLLEFGMEREREEPTLVKRRLDDDPIGDVQERRRLHAAVRGFNTRTSPVWSTMNRRSLSSGANVRSNGATSPSATSCTPIRCRLSRAATSDTAMIPRKLARIEQAGTAEAGEVKSAKCSHRRSPIVRGCKKPGIACESSRPSASSNDTPGSEGSRKAVGSSSPHASAA